MAQVAAPSRDLEELRTLVAQSNKRARLVLTPDATVCAEFEITRGGEREVVRVELFDVVKDGVPVEQGWGFV